MKSLRFRKKKLACLAGAALVHNTPTTMREVLAESINYTPEYYKEVFEMDKYPRFKIYEPVFTYSWQ